jgi:hypothetical protein
LEPHELLPWTSRARHRTAVNVLIGPAEMLSEMILLPWHLKLLPRITF